MAVSFPRFSWCWWGNNGKEKQAPRSGSKLNWESDSGSGFRESDNLRFPGGDRRASKLRKVKKKWSSREEMMRKRVDLEFDVVLVPSDGGLCLSASESDESDWSIGWSEPYGPEFQSSDNDSDNSFAVLVPCYSHRSEEVVESPDLLDALRSLPNKFSSEGKNHMEQWLASFPKF